MRRADELASAGVTIFLVLCLGAAVAGGALVWSLVADHATQDELEQ